MFLVANGIYLYNKELILYFLYIKIMPAKKTTEKKTARTAPKKEVKSTKTTEAKEFNLEKKAAEVERKIEKFEGKTDKEVEKFVWQLWFVDKIISASWVKEILNLSFMEKANKWVRKNLEIICKILWILWIIGWVLLLVLTIGSLLTLNFGSFIISLVCAAFVILMSRGCLKMRKRFPAASIVCMALAIIWLIISILFGWFGCSLLSTLIWFICTLFVLKNKDMFKN